MFAQTRSVTLSPAELVVKRLVAPCQTDIQVKTKKETMITSLPEVIRSHIYEFDGTYREILATQVFPEIHSHVWSQWENKTKQNKTKQNVIT